MIKLMGPILSSVIIIIGCFLPWLQLGTIFINRGIDNTDGAIMLVLGIIAGAVGISNYRNETQSNLWVYILVGTIGIITVIMDLNEVDERANNIAESLGTLGGLFSDDKPTIDKVNIIGSGLYVMAIGSVGLLLSGFGVFNASSPNENIYKVKAPKYAIKAQTEKIEVEIVKSDEEIENERYRNNLNRLHELIQEQKAMLFGGELTETITSFIKHLASTYEDAIYLLNTYESVFGSDLIEDIKKIDTNYKSIKSNLSIFIDFGIISENFPHKPLK